MPAPVPPSNALKMSKFHARSHFFEVRLGVESSLSISASVITQVSLRLSPPPTYEGQHMHGTSTGHPEGKYNVWILRFE